LLEFDELQPQHEWFDCGGHCFASEGFDPAAALAGEDAAT